MENNITLFMKKLSEDENLQKKAEAAAKALPADASDEEKFDKVIAPLAKELGLEFTFEDCVRMKDDLSVSEEELRQTAGGDNLSGLNAGTGAGGSICKVVGVGMGITLTPTAGAVCYVLGFGGGGGSFCFILGASK